MRPEVKFCGLTRREDAARAEALGARFGGVIFAGGPRERPAPVACAVLDAAPGLRRVGVIGMRPLAEVEELVRAVRLDVLQLHADPEAEDIEAVRRATGCEVWGVLRLEGTTFPARSLEVLSAADAVLIEPRLPGRLGGGGVVLDWAAIAAPLSAIRGSARVVLAGGLTPINVQEGVRAVAPAIVDVSSGVESSPGIKDHQLMQAFAEAVAG